MALPLPLPLPTFLPLPADSRRPRSQQGLDLVIIRQYFKCCESRLQCPNPDESRYISYRDNFNKLYMS